MKKLIILFLGLAIISCGGSDDDESMGRTTDPIIGNWRWSSGGDIERWNFSSSGNLTFLRSSSDFPEDNLSASGRWTNNGNDFNSLSQTYMLEIPNEEDVTLSVIFNADFDEWTGYCTGSGCDEPTYTRQ